MWQGALERKKNPSRGNRNGFRVGLLGGFAGLRRTIVIFDVHLFDLFHRGGNAPLIEHFLFFHRVAEATSRRDEFAGDDVLLEAVETSV